MATRAIPIPGTLTSESRLPHFFCRFFSLFVFLALVVVACPAVSSELELDIFHVNDVHGFISSRDTAGEQSCGGMGRLSAALSRLRLEAKDRGAATVFVSAGDMFQGTPVVDRTRGECMIRLFDRLGLDVCCLGNHEFDYGPEVLTRRLQEAHFAALAENISTSLPIRTLFKKGFVLPVGPLRVGLIGITTPNTKVVCIRENVEKFEFLEPEGVLSAAIERLRNEGADVVVALSHCGIEQDRALADQVKGIDLIVGGHSHTVMQSVQTIGRTSIVQAGFYGRYLGEVRLAVEPGVGSRLRSYRLLPLCSPEFEPEPKVEAEVEHYLSPLFLEMDQVIGELAVDLPKGFKGDDSPAASLVAEAMREGMGVEVAVVNVGGVRRGLSKGPVTVGQLFEMLPFGNSLVTMELDGRSLRAALERSVSGQWSLYSDQELRQISEGSSGRKLVRGYGVGRRNVGFLQTAGLSYSFDPRLKEGARIVLALVGREPLRDERFYTVACARFLAQGGDGMREFHGGRNRRERPFKERDIVTSYFSKYRPLRSVPNVTVKNLANTLAPQESAVGPKAN